LDTKQGFCQIITQKKDFFLTNSVPNSEKPMDKDDWENKKATRERLPS
jgi:hypothetical protein